MVAGPPPQDRQEGGQQNRYDQKYCIRVAEHTQYQVPMPTGHRPKIDKKTVPDVAAYIGMRRPNDESCINIRIGPVNGG